MKRIQQELKAFANDAGLNPPDHNLRAAAFLLFLNHDEWNGCIAIIGERTEELKVLSESVAWACLDDDSAFIKSSCERIANVIESLKTNHKDLSKAVGLEFD